MKKKINGIDNRAYVAGIFVSAIFIIYAIISIVMLAAIREGYPKTALECFKMINENRFTALLRLDIVSVVAMPFYFVLFYVIYWILKDLDDFIAKAAFLLTFAGIILFISDINILSILRLSDKYFSTESLQYKNQLLSACESLLASDMWITANAKIRGIMTETGAIILSMLMWRSGAFSKSVAVLGLLAHSFDLASEIVSIFIPAVKEIFTIVAGPLYVIWLIMLMINFLRLLRTRNPA